MSMTATPHTQHRSMTWSAPTGPFSKRERMAGRKLVETLFGGNDSRSLAAYPLRAVFMIQPRPAGALPVQLLVSVSKRHFKHAVDRNRVKRQLREAYRRHRTLLQGAVGDGQQLLLAMIWLSDSHSPSHDVDKRAASLLRRTAEKLQQR